MFDRDSNILSKSKECLTDDKNHHGPQYIIMDCLDISSNGRHSGIAGARVAPITIDISIIIIIIIIDFI